MVALDLKGFGDSDKPFMASKYRDDVILEELKKFVDVLQENDKKIIVMGHGLGGQIGWRFVEKYPDTVSKFISISTPHPHIWLRHIMRSWRSIVENRWLYVCRLPFLPEMEMMANDLEIFDKKFRKVFLISYLSRWLPVYHPTYHPPPTLIYPPIYCRKWNSAMDLSNYSHVDKVTL